MSLDLSRVTRFEVIDESGRVLHKNTGLSMRATMTFDFHVQDDGRTFKIFVKTIHPDREKKPLSAKNAAIEAAKIAALRELKGDG